MQYNFLNQLMQLYGIGQPLTNQMLKFSGNQFGPQQFEQPQRFNNGFAPQPTVQPNQPVQQAIQPQAPFGPQGQPVAPTTNTLSPQGHFKTVSPNFQMPNFGPKAGIPGTGNNSITGGFDINYLTPTRG
jgi:hypothetical protein